MGLSLSADLGGLVNVYCTVCILQTDSFDAMDDTEQDGRLLQGLYRPRADQTRLSFSLRSVSDSSEVVHAGISWFRCPECC